MPPQPNIEQPAPRALHRDLFCANCRAPLGAHIDLCTGTLLVMRHGQLIVILERNDSGRLVCEVCGHDYRWGMPQKRVKKRKKAGQKRGGC